MRGRRLSLRATAFLLSVALLVPLGSAFADEVVPAPAPPAPVITSPVRKGVVRTTLTVRGRTSGGAEVVSVSTASGVTTAPVTVAGSGEGTFSVDVRVPYGKSSIVVAAGSAAGYSPGVSVAVYNLGKLPAFKHMVLVDKSDLELYRIRNGQVEASYPVAIGMPGTPTPTGRWTLGARQWMSRGGPWGVLRMPLLHKARVKRRVTIRHGRNHYHKWVWRTVYRGNGYYIHGTNAPWSIGTEASHGCVRMYNSSVLSLSRVVRGWPVSIRS